MTTLDVPNAAPLDAQKPALVNEDEFKSARDMVTSNSSPNHTDKNQMIKVVPISEEQVLFSFLMTVFDIGKVELRGEASAQATRQND